MLTQRQLDEPTGRKFPQTHQMPWLVWHRFLEPANAIGFTDHAPCHELTQMPDHPPPPPIPVWDLPLRLFHWILVSVIPISWLTAEAGIEWMQVHTWVGLLALALLVFRLLWGFWGTPTARFVQFVRGPKAAAGYARGLLHGREAHRIGHNPLGAYMVLLLLVLVAIQAATGLFSSDDIFIEGPLAGYLGSDARDFVTSWHHFNFNLLIAAIGVHIAAALWYWIVRKNNLIGPMVTGHSRDPQLEAPVQHQPRMQPRMWSRALLCALVSALLAAGINQL